MNKIFVGIDVAKESSNGHGLNAKGETLFSGSSAESVDKKMSNAV